MATESGFVKDIEQPPSPLAGWTDVYVLANGIRIHYWRTGGDKPVLLMAHGSSDDGLCWTNLARELEEDYDIIMPDARGHGLSDPPARSDSADVQCDDLAGLIGELKLDKPILMGHSMGSASVAWFAARYPNIPRAVILEDPRLIPRPPGDPRASATTAGQEKRRAHILERNNSTYDELVAGCMKNNPQWGRSECEFWAPSKRRHHPDSAFRRLGERPSVLCPWGISGGNVYSPAWRWALGRRAAARTARADVYAIEWSNKNTVLVPRRKCGMRWRNITC